MGRVPWEFCSDSTYTNDRFPTLPFSGQTLRKTGDLVNTQIEDNEFMSSPFTEKI